MYMRLDEYPAKAKDKCLQFVNWMYVATLEDSPIDNMTTELSEDDDIITDYEGITNQILGGRTPPSDINPNSLNNHSHLMDSLAVSQITTQESLQTFIESTKERSERSSKSLYKLAPSYKRMLLVAGSIGEAILDKIADEGMEFYSQPNEKSALIYLNRMMENHSCRAQVPVAMATQLYHGALRWESTNKPSGLSACCLEYLEIDRRDILMTGLVIDLSTKFEMTQKTIDKLTKSHVLLPTSTDDLIERVKGLGLISTTLWGDNSRLPHQLHDLVKFISHERLTIASQEATSPNYIAKIMVAIDFRVNKWLLSCQKATHGRDTNDFCIDFTDMTKAIFLNQFDYDLPAGIQSLHKDEGNGTDYEISPGKRRKGRDGTIVKAKQEAVEYVGNNQMDPTWKLRKGERYEAVFQNKVLKGPMLTMGCKGCHRWHNKGMCFKGCANEDSHKQLTGKDHTTFDNYVKQCRGEQEA